MLVLVLYLLYSIKATNTDKLLRHNRELTLLILTHYLPVALGEMKSQVSLFFKKLEKIARDRGIPFVIKYVKDSRLAVMRFLSGSPLSSMDLVKLDSSGWPTWLSQFKQFTTRPEHLKVLFTLLMCLRSLKLSPVLDTSTIVTATKSQNLTDSEIKCALRILGIGPISTEWTSFHMTVKNGPVGQALIMSSSEATLLPKWLIHSLNVVAGKKLASRLDDLISSFDILPESASQMWVKVYPLRSNLLRRLSYFSDKEGKTRVIGLLDYWTQTALRPLHNSLNEILRRLHSDCTFDQNRFLALLRDKPIYYSIDLTCATDRLPITFQKKVLGYLIGAEKAQCWVDLLVKLGFECKGKTYTYAAGQPMGAYSSWPAMALCHHIIVQVAFLRTIPNSVWPKVRRPFKDYALLGDDLVIANHLVAKEYFCILEQLDMKFSPQKTHISKYLFEFAKRVYFNGVEITGYSVGGLKAVWKSYPLLSNFLDNQESHGYVLCHENFGSFVLSLNKLMRSNRYSFEHANRLLKLLRVFRELSKDKMTGTFTNTFLCIRDAFGHSLPSSHLYDADDFLRKVVIFARKKLAEKDLDIVSQSHAAVFTRLSAMVEQYLKAWPDQDQYTLQFLRETVPAMLRNNSPLLASIDDVIELFREAIIKSDFDSIEALGLAKYFIGKSTFSMRTQESRVLAQSALVKVLLNIVKDAPSELFIKELYPNLEGNSVIYL